MWADTRETLQLTRVDRDPSALKWSPDGTQILFTMNLRDDTPILPVKLPQTPRGAQLAPGAVVVDRLSWAPMGPVRRSRATTTYSSWTRASAECRDRSPRATTTTAGRNGRADGKTIFVSGIRKPDAEYLRGDSEIHAVDVASLDVKTLTDRKGPDGGPLASPDGKWIAYTGYDDKNFTSTLSNLYVMDTSGGGKRLWLGNLPSSPSDIVWATDGSGVYYSMEERGEANEYFVAVAQGSQPKRVTNGAHMLTNVSIAKNGQAVAIRASHKRSRVCWSRFRSTRPAEMKTLVDVNADVLSNVTLG